jgi:hypothetical protein
LRFQLHLEPEGEASKYGPILLQNCISVKDSSSCMKIRNSLEERELGFLAGVWLYRNSIRSSKSDFSLAIGWQREKGTCNLLKPRRVQSWKNDGSDVLLNRICQRPLQSIVREKEMRPIN